MQIYAINSQLNTQKHKPMLFQHFGAKKITPKLNNVCCDVFEKITEPDSTLAIFTKHVNNINTRIKEQLRTFTPEQLETAIIETKKAHPDISERKILTVMQRLTQWADYNCFPAINSHLNKIGSGIIRENFDITNNSLLYLQTKNIITRQSPKKKQIIFVTPNNVDKINPKDTLKYKFIALDGFEKGINFLTDSNMLGEKTINFISEIKSYIKSHQNISFKEAINELINGDLFDKSCDKNIFIHKIQRKKPATRESILEQMRPNQPKHPDEIKILIELLAKRFTTENPKEFENLRNNIAKYYDYNFLPFSKQKIIADLKELHIKINEELEKHNIPKDNVFLVTNEYIKSYDLISDMYARQFNIPEKNIKKMAKILEVNFNPENSGFLILDDISVSGISFEDFCNYSTIGYYLNKDQHIFFCPVQAHHKGIDNIKNRIYALKRENIDDIITLDKNIYPYINEADYVDLIKYFDNNSCANNAMGYQGFEDNMLCTVFPFTVPDNNSDLASFITKQFLPRGTILDSAHQDLFDVEFDMLHSAKRNYLLQFIKKTNNN